MRINKYLALTSQLSRRGADAALAAGRVHINGQVATIGSLVKPTDVVSLDGTTLRAPMAATTILFHKPVGYVCSRRGQGSKTIFELLPNKFQQLQPVGRLDKDSSGLLLLSDDGDLAHHLTHPSFEKTKVYEVTLDNELMPRDFERITRQGIKLDDGLSTFKLDYINDDNFKWLVTMHEGRNRQIRRTFETAGYKVLGLHRIQFGDYQLGKLPPGEWRQLPTQK